MPLFFLKQDCCPCNICFRKRYKDHAMLTLLAEQVGSSKTLHSCTQYRAHVRVMYHANPARIILWKFHIENFHCTVNSTMCSEDHQDSYCRSSRFSLNYPGSWLIHGAREFTKHPGKRNLLVYSDKQLKPPVLLR